MSLLLLALLAALTIVGGIGNVDAVANLIQSRLASAILKLQAT